MAKLNARGRRARRSAEEWRCEVASWRESGLSAVEYAKEKDLRAQTLKFWASRLRRQGDAGAAAASAAVKVGTGSSFLPVRVADRRARGERSGARLSVEIELRQGGCMRVSGELDIRQLTELLAAAQSAHGGGSC